MPRSVRLEYEGAFYHVMARGNRRLAIFRDDDDRRSFVHGLGQICEKTGWRVHAWVLLSNHYHLFIETPEPNLVAGMKWLQNAYTRRFNTRHGEWGRLFGDRYKAIPVEGRQGEYHGTLTDYLHLNPVRAGLIELKSGQSLLDYPWSSLATGYARPPGQRPAWLAAEVGLAELGCPDTAAGRKRYVARLETRAREESRAGCGVPDAPADERVSHLRRGWYWGSQGFAERLRGRLDHEPKATKNRTYRASAQQKEHGEARAEAILAESLAREGLKRGEIERLPGNDPRKVRAAVEIWRETAVSQGWIAEHLQMKSAANVSQILRRTKCAGTLSEYVD